VAEQYQRVIPFENILNFRDLGGYKAQGGHAVAWRRVFRSGEIHPMTPSDFKKIKDKLNIKTVLDLRSDFEIAKDGLGLISGSGIKHFQIPLIKDGGDREANIRRYSGHTNMGQFYVCLSGQKDYVNGIINALEIISIKENHPLVFHCSAGRDRTGFLASILLSVLGVPSSQIEKDYCLSEPCIRNIVNQRKANPEINDVNTGLPEYFWKTVPSSIALLLSTLKKEYGSVGNYLKNRGAEPSLVRRLKQSLLV
jgi:protein-tyrosine phosphatase